MAQENHFFLGANTGSGFYGLYPSFLQVEDTYDYLLLKGGPGVGKSSFMRRIAQRLEEAGEQVEYILCSGDPHSLDGIRVERLGYGIVDATAPHVMEPQYPAAVDRCLDLGRFYDLAAMKPLREEVMTAAQSYRQTYRRAYRSLAVARQVREDAVSHLELRAAAEKAVRRAKGIAKRELSGKCRAGGVLQKRILGGVTCLGRRYCWETVEQLCPRVYGLSDSCGIGSEALQYLCQTALAQGERVIACPDPEHPDRWAHLLLPEKGVAFVTLPQGEQMPVPLYRHLRLDAMVEAAQWREQRTQLRFARRIAGELEQEAIARLREAKAQHDVLEGLYNPHVDFLRVYEQAEREAERIVAYARTLEGQGKAR